jgi:BlaI family transcriptional regulator, penicillinase repressor
MNVSRRERQLLEILYRRGEATAAEVQEELNDGSTYSAVRGMLRVLTEKEMVSVRAEGVRYIFKPSTPRDEAAKSAVHGVVDTFFSGRVSDLVSTLLSEQDQSLDDSELDRLSRMIEAAKAKKKGTP